MTDVVTLDIFSWNVTPLYRRTRRSLRESERSMLAKEQPICSYGIRNRIKYLGAALIRNRNFNIVQLKIDCLRISNSENA